MKDIKEFMDKIDTFDKKNGLFHIKKSIVEKYLKKLDRKFDFIKQIWTEKMVSKTEI